MRDEEGRGGEGREGERREGEGEKKPDCTVPTCPSSRDMMEQHLFQCVGCGLKLWPVIYAHLRNLMYL